MRKRIIIFVLTLVLIFNTLLLFSCARATPPAPVPAAPLKPATVVFNPAPPPAPVSAQIQLPDLRQVINIVKASVVAINVEATTFDFFNQPATVTGAGSGWIIDKNGYIVTNNHVVEGADSVKVTLNDGRTFTGTDIRTDPFTDLAVIKIDARNLPVLGIGSSAGLEIGDFVLAVGNALGMGLSATFGIVSALDVTLEASPDQTLHGLIQTDAAINPGNSGGPLVNTAGEVIGINSIKVSQVGVEGMGYAISIDEAMPIIQTLINTGCFIRPWPGMGYTSVDSQIASFYNLPVDTGALVIDIAPKGPAEAAGLQPGDIIVAADGKTITDASELTQLINSDAIGQKINITYWRGSRKSNLSLTLAESPC